MIAPVLALALLGAPPTDQRATAAFISLTPRGARGAPARGVLLEGADAALRRATALGLRSAEQLGLDQAALDGCPRAELLGCILAHVAARTTVSAAVILTVVPQDDRRHRLSLALVDVARAEDARARGRGDPAAIEDAIFAGAIHLEPTTIDASSPRAVEAWIRAALPARAPGDDPPRWLEPLAAIVLDGLAGPMDVTLDGLPRGVASPEARALVDLDAGPRRIELASALHTATADVVLEPGVTSTVSLTLVRAPDPLRTPLAYAGVGVAATGAALAIVSAVSASSVTRRCLVRPGEETASCDGLGWPGFGVRTDALPALSSGRVHGGPPLLPIGAGLLGAGASLLVLQTVLHDAERSRLVDVAIVIAAAAVGVTAGALAAP